MAVYLTRTMLDRMNQVNYPSCSKIEPESSYSLSDHWQKLFSEGNNLKLSHANLCRVCGRHGYTPISEKLDGYGIHLAIRSVSSVSVDLGDSLPKFICTDCLEKLKLAMDFKKMCEASERKFKKILNPMGDPSLHSYPYSKHDFQLILHDMKLKKMKIEEEKTKERQMRERSLQKPKGKEFKCSSCDMTFQVKELLSKHRRERLCMRRACDVCGQLVVSIKQHMRQIHKQPVCHKCPSCGKEFPIFARLKNHMMTHTNTFSFFCDLCPYKCKHKYYLVMHMRTHTGEKPYKCQQCPATFVNPSNLNKHKLTHQEKQFKCLLCEKAFRTNAGLREHHEAAHMHIKHTCNFCGRDFCYRSDLRKHEIRNHNRTKRDYIGGEPSYKQVERMQKLQETTDVMDKWHTQEIIVAQAPPQIIQATYIDTSKDYRQNQAIYFSDVTGLITQQPMHQMVPQQTVEITLPELTLKKDDVKLAYETQQGIGYY